MVTLAAQTYMVHWCRNPNFDEFRSTTSLFRVTGHFETSALNDPKMTLNTTMSKVHQIRVTSNIVTFSGGSVLNIVPFSTTTLFRKLAKYRKWTE